MSDDNTFHITPYQRFQLEWMLSHEKSLDALISELSEKVSENVDDCIPYEVRMDLEESPAKLEDTYAAWQSDAGFGGEIWPCEDEFHGEDEPALAKKAYITEPLSKDELKSIADDDNYVSGNVVVDLDDIVDDDLELFLDELSTSLVGDDLLQDITYALVGTTDDGRAIIEVSGDASYEIDDDME